MIEILMLVFIGGCASLTWILNIATGYAIYNILRTKALDRLREDEEKRK